MDTETDRVGRDDGTGNGPRVRVAPDKIDTAFLRQAIATNRHLTSPSNQAVRTAAAIEYLRRQSEGD